MQIRTQPKRAAAPDTAERILDLAERLVQTRGFNAFSYADIASEIGITKASLHYHFSTKAELGRRLIERYLDAFANSLASIDASGVEACEKLRRYMAIYAKVLHDDRLCLCGMLAADFMTLPEPMKASIRLFFDANETWLAAVLTQGRSSGVLSFGGSPSDCARLIIASLEGAMLVARSYGDLRRFEAASDRLIASVGK